MFNAFAAAVNLFMAICGLLVWDLSGYAVALNASVALFSALLAVMD